MGMEWFPDRNSSKVSLIGFLINVWTLYYVLRNTRYCIKDLGLKLSEDHIDDMVAMADKDGDGQVSYIEFIAMMMKNQTASQAPPPPYSRFWFDSNNAMFSLLCTLM